MTVKDDVLILGGGVIGLACAHYLLRAGRSVRVVERGTVGSGASHGNCGTLTPSHAPPLAAPGMIAQALRWMARPDAPLYIRPRADLPLARWLLRFAARCNPRDWRASALAKGALLSASRTELEALVRDHRLACEFAADGLVYAFRDPRLLDRNRADFALLHELGIAAEAWDASRLAAEEPALLPGMAGGIHYAGDAMLRPDRYVDELARIVRAAGGVIAEHTPVQALRRSGDGVDVVTADGVLRARDVVLALGAWSPQLTRGLGLRVPIQPGKGYSITYTRPSRAPRRPLVLKDRSVCVTAWDSGYRLGSTMEFAGYDATLNRVRLDALVRGAREFLHEPEGPQRVEEWFGWRPMTWDDLPLIGAAPGVAGLTLACGHGMMGVSMSAATGRLVAELLTGASPCIDPRPYAPARFA